MRPVILACCLLAGCGYVGDPLPPALHIPRTVTDLAALQVGDSVRARFTIPALTTDTNVVLRNVAGIEFQINDRIIAMNETEPGPVEVRLPLKDWVGATVRIAVRVASDRGRWSGWSNGVTLAVIPPVAPPADIQADSDAKGLKLRWQAKPGTRTRILKVDAATGETAIAAEVEGAEWIDTAAFGTEYAYQLQSLARAGAGSAESESSPVIRFTPRDRFPPSPPQDLTAIAAIATIELAWQRSPEPDAVGYFVYRATGTGEMKRISEQTPAASFSDRDVRSGESYRYEVTAIDDKGNESPHSAAVTVMGPQ